MRAFVIDTTQGDLFASVVDAPEPHDGEVIIRVEWSGVNFKDAQIGRAHV